MSYVLLLACDGPLCLARFPDPATATPGQSFGLVAQLARRDGWSCADAKHLCPRCDDTERSIKRHV